MPLVDGACRKQGSKRGAGRERVQFEDFAVPESLPQEDTLAVNEALQKLA